MNCTRPAEEDDHGPPPRRRRRDLRAARAVAERFVHAFLRYELGEADREVARVLRATAGRRLARELLELPARRLPGARPRRGRVVALVVGHGARGLPLTAVATIERDGHRSALTLVLRRTEARWRVTETGA